jgi:hypothetical protein
MRGNNKYTYLIGLLKGSNELRHGKQNKIKQQQTVGALPAWHIVSTHQSLEDIV